MTFTEEQIIDAIDRAPEAVRKAATGADTILFIRSFVQKYGLHIDTVGKVVQMNRNLLLGLMSPAEFLGELVQEGIDANTARKIMGELNEKIFVPVQQQMRGTGAMPRPMSAPTQRPESVSAPVIAAATPQPTAQIPVSSAARTAPPPPNLPGVMPEQGTISQAPRVEVPAPAPGPAQSTPAPAAPAAPLNPAPSIPPIYSAEPAPAVPPLKAAPSQTNLMWQTPVPSAWQQKGDSRAAAAAHPMAPPEKPAPRTMETDIQQMAQRAAAPAVPAPAAMPVVSAPVPTYAPEASAPAMPTISEPPLIPVYRNDAPARPIASSYVPPPRPAVAPARFSGDPYREPIEASDL